MTQKRYDWGERQPFVDEALRIFGNPTDFATAMAFWQLVGTLERGEKPPHWAFRRLFGPTAANYRDGSLLGRARLCDGPHSVLSRPPAAVQRTDWLGMSLLQERAESEHRADVVLVVSE